MTSDNAPYVVFYALAAVFVTASLFGRRIPLGSAAKMAVAWVAIFAVAFTLFAFREDLSGIGQRLKAEAFGTPVVEGQTVRIPIADDGHYWVRATLNGQSVRFMVDSGASVTTVSAGTAKQAGIIASGMKGVVSTANGQIVVDQASADRLEVGSIVRTDLPVDVTPRDDVNLLGMNFLRTLSSWKVEGHDLVLVS